MEYKKLLIMLYAVIGFLVMSLSIHFGFLYLHDMNQWSGLAYGLLIMILSVVVYFAANGSPLFYVLSFLLNMVGVGFSITAYYVFKAYALNFEDFLTAYVLSIGLIGLFSLLTYVKWIKRFIKPVLILLVIGFFIGSLLLWINVEAFTGLSFYFLNVAYFYLIAIMSKKEDMKALMSEMSIVSFGAFILVSFIVLVILTEGDALQGVEIFGDGIAPTRRKEKGK